MENLATTLTKQLKHTQAEQMYRDIWNVRRRFLGKYDLKTIESMFKLAVVLLERDEATEAGMLHQQVVYLRKRLLGENDPSTRLAMAHLAMALRAQGKNKKAEPYIAELIKLRAKEARSPNADAKAQNDYALLLLTCEPAELRDAEAALPFAEEAAKLSGRRSADILDTLALAQEMTGRLKEAIKTQKDAIGLLSPTDFKDGALYEQTLAKYYKEEGDLDALEGWYRDSLARARATMPTGSRGIGTRLVLLGRFLLEQERYSEAEPVLREILDISKKALPKNHWRIFVAESAIGESLTGQGRFEDAERLVVNAYLNMKADPRASADEVSASLQRVIALYTAWGKTDEAAKYRAMLPPEKAVAKPNP